MWFTSHKVVHQSQDGSTVTRWFNNHKVVQQTQWQVKAARQDRQRVSMTKYLFGEDETESESV